MAWDSRRASSKPSRFSRTPLDGAIPGIPFAYIDSSFTNSTNVPFDDFDGRFKNDLASSNDVSRSLTPEPGCNGNHQDSTAILHPSHFKTESLDLRRLPTRKFLRSWGLEILATILAVGALLSIVSVLRVYNGRAVEGLDIPGALTLNGLLALLGTILRAFLAVPLGASLSQEAWLWLARDSSKAMPPSKLQDLSLSDAASRGAWGSLLLLLKPSSWRRLITCFGAIVIIFCLSIDTFTQQLVDTANAPVTDKNSLFQPGNVPWSQRYASFQGNPAEGAFGPSLPIKAAAYNGFLADGVDDVLVRCLTGNCTFPPTPSLAVCGSCATISNTLGACNATICNYTTSTGTNFEMAHFNSTDMGIGFRSISVYNASTASSYNLTIADFEVLGAPYQSLSAGLMGTTPQWPSQRCQLWLCVNVYETSISNGEQTQNITASYSHIPNTLNSGFSGGDNWTFTLPEQWNEQQYNVSTLGWAALQEQLARMVTGTVVLNLEGYSTSGDTIEAIWNGTEGSLGKWTEKLTTSLTNAIRSASSASSPTFDGSAYQLSVEVRWLWLILPTSLVLAAIVLLVVVMIRTARRGIRSWKGSPLAMLYFDIDDDLKVRQRAKDDDGVVLGSHSSNSGEDRVLAEKTVVLQRMENDGYRLRSWRSN